MHVCYVNFKVDADYPRRIAQTWLGCPGSLSEKNYMEEELNEESAQYRDSESLPDKVIPAGASTVVCPLLSVSIISAVSMWLISMLCYYAI